MSIDGSSPASGEFHKRHIDDYLVDHSEELSGVR